MALRFNEEEFLHEENGHILSTFYFPFLLLLGVCREGVEMDVPFRGPYHPTGRAWTLNMSRTAWETIGGFPWKYSPKW